MDTNSNLPPMSHQTIDRGALLSCRTAAFGLFRQKSRRNGSVHHFETFVERTDAVLFYNTKPGSQMVYTTILIDY
jgi:hypothetical protein